MYREEVEQADLDIENIADQVMSEAGRHDSSVDGFTVESDHETISVFLHYCTMDEPQLVMTRPAR